MLFKQELTEQIVRGNKTQTRRPIKPGERLVERDGLKTVLTKAGRIKHQVGRDYAVCYGRGKPTRWYHTQHNFLLGWEGYDGHVHIHGEDYERELRREGFQPLRIRITGIYVEDVRNILHQDALAEGFKRAPKHEFLYAWMMFYDDTFAGKMLDTEYDSALPDHCPLWLWDRPDERYQAWVYHFELVKKGESNA